MKREEFVSKINEAGLGGKVFVNPNRIIYIIFSIILGSGLIPVINGLHMKMMKEESMKT